VKKDADLDRVRCSAVSRAFATSADLQTAVETLGFVQADPIRAPARAQDLTLRHRAPAYRAGDLERRYATLAIEEDFFINYGFLPRAVQALMHPRAAAQRIAGRNKRERALIEYVRERGEVHPRDVDAHFSHGTVTNYWGGSSSATTHLLNQLHYRGVLRIARRDGGIRVYAIREPAIEALDRAERERRMDRLIDVLVHKYAPLPGSTLSFLVRRLRYGVPQWERELGRALIRTRARLQQVRIGKIDWYWPVGESLVDGGVPDVVRLLAPFDPLVWDRDRFAALWGWEYRFEAYTPAPKRKFGYYALPLLWRDQVIGWGNLSTKGGALDARIGYIADRPPRERAFRRELDAELDRMRTFLALTSADE